MWTLFFNPGPVTDYEGAKKSDNARFGKFFWGMLDRGVYLPCSQFEAAFLSAAHTEEHVAQTLAAAREALAAAEGSGSGRADELHPRGSRRGEEIPGPVPRQVGGR